MDLAVALVGGLIGGTVAAIIGGIVTLRVQGRQHTFEREMAREERNQRRRSAAYVRILEHQYRIGMWVTRSAPLVGPPGRTADAASRR